MRNPTGSSELWEEFYQDSSAFILYATIYYANGSSESFTSEDFVEGSFSYSEHSCGISTFSINEVYSAEAKVTMNNRGNRIGKRNFQNAFIAYELRLTDERTEYENNDLKLPHLIITEAEYRGEYIELTALDYISADDGKQTISSVPHDKLEDIAYDLVTTEQGYHGINFGTIGMYNSVPATTFSTPLSVREFLSACAEIMGCMTVLEYGNSYLTGKFFPLYDFTDDIDGGTFGYDDGDFAYGGEFYGTVGNNMFPVIGANDYHGTTATLYSNGITWTIYDNGVVVANGTALEDCDFDLLPHYSRPTYNDILTISAGLEGCTRSTYYIYGTVCNDESDEVGFDAVTTSGEPFNVSTDTINSWQYAYFGSLYLRICSGVTVNNLTFQPSLSYPPHTNFMSPYELRPNGSLGVWFSEGWLESFPFRFCVAFGYATGNFPNAPLKSGMLLKAGTYTMWNDWGTATYECYMVLGIHFYDDAETTQRYSGEFEGLNSDEDSVYRYSTTDGDLRTDSNTKGVYTFTIYQDAYVNAKIYTVGLGHPQIDYTNQYSVPTLYTGKWDTIQEQVVEANSRKLYQQFIYDCQNRNLFFCWDELDMTQTKAYPFYNMVSGERGFCLNVNDHDFSFLGTPYTDLIVPLAEDFCVLSNDYILRTNYDAEVKPPLRISDTQTGEVIYEGTDDSEELTIENGYYSGHLLVEEGVDYGSDGEYGIIRPTLTRYDPEEGIVEDGDYWTGAWTQLPEYDGGLFAFWRSYRPVIRKSDAYPLAKIMQNPIVRSSIITITGVEVSGDNIETVRYGTEGYVVKIKNNPLITTQQFAEYAASRCFSSLDGVSFVPFSVSNSANPRLECCDPVLFQDVHNNDVVTFPTGVEYHLGNLTTVNLTDQNVTENATFSEENEEE